MKCIPKYFVNPFFDIEMDCKTERHQNVMYSNTVCLMDRELCDSP